MNRTDILAMFQPTVSQQAARRADDDTDYLIFCQSVKAGDTADARRAYFGPNYLKLSVRWQGEQPNSCSCGEPIDEDLTSCTDCRHEENAERHGA